MNLFVRIGDYSKQFFLVVLFFLSIFSVYRPIQEQILATLQKHRTSHYL